MKIESIQLISDKVLAINWDDGHESIYFADHLRENCPCASCDALRDGNPDGNGLFKRLNLNRETIVITGFDVIGRYAVAIKFSDGHDTGIYTYDHLRKICQCDICTGNVVRIQGPLR